MDYNIYERIKMNKEQLLELIKTLKIDKDEY